MDEIIENLNEARQAAFLGNYDASQIFYNGVLYELTKLMQNYAEEKLRVSKQTLVKYEQLIRIENQQVKDLAKKSLTFYIMKYNSREQ